MMSQPVGKDSGFRERRSVKGKVISIRDCRKTDVMEFLVEKIGVRNNIFEEWVPIHQLFHKMHMVATFLKKVKNKAPSNLILIQEVTESQETNNFSTRIPDSECWSLLSIRACGIEAMGKYEVEFLETLSGRIQTKIMARQDLLACYPMEFISYLQKQTH